MLEEIWIASNNAHKLQEIAQILPEHTTIHALRDLEKPFEIEETGKTFEENALLKARALYEAIKKPVIADDSGLEVMAMDGRPGVYSSRFMGEDTPYTIKNQAIIDAVDAAGKTREAKYVCVIAYIDEKGKEHVYRGEMKGEITREPMGENGFGYDPVFYFPLFEATNAQVSPEIKNEHSHRARALQAFANDQRFEK